MEEPSHEPWDIDYDGAILTEEEAIGLFHRIGKRRKECQRDGLPYPGMIDKAKQGIIQMRLQSLYGKRLLLTRDITVEARVDHGSSYNTPAQWLGKINPHPIILKKGEIIRIGEPNDRGEHYLRRKKEEGGPFIQSCILPTLEFVDAIDEVR